MWQYFELLLFNFYIDIGSKCSENLHSFIFIWIWVNIKWNKHNSWNDNQLFKMTTYCFGSRSLNFTWNPRQTNLMSILFRNWIIENLGYLPSFVVKCSVVYSWNNSVCYYYVNFLLTLVSKYNENLHLFIFMWIWVKVKWKSKN